MTVQSVRLGLKNAVFWDAEPCRSYKNRRFGRMYRLQDQDDKNRPARNNVSINQQPQSLRSMLRLLVTANVVSS
jgi:hypothetical protein